MAKLEDLLPFIEKWEGGYVNDPLDLGGATNMGVTIGTWKMVGYDKDGDGDIDVDDLKQITREDMKECVLRPHYWNRCRADEIKSQAIANIMVDWVWASGVTGIKQVQTLLGVKVDGIVGEKTLNAINSAQQRDLFLLIKEARVAYVEHICMKRPANMRFRKGWLRRIEELKWLPVLLMFLLPLVSGCRSAASYKKSHIQENTLVQATATNVTKLTEDVLQSTSSLTTLQVGEVLEMKIIRLEYDSITPTIVRRETRALINKRTDALQETQQSTEVEQQTTIHEKEDIKQEVRQQVKEEVQEVGMKPVTKWWLWLFFIALGLVGVLWWRLR